MSDRLLSSRSLPNGVRGLLLTPCERRFANAIRAVTRGADLLYHRTRYAPEIVASGQLLCAPSATRGISFGRVPEVAVYSAVLTRADTTCEPVVLMVDRVSLRCRYQVEPHHDGWKGHGGGERDEAEEIVWEDIWDLGRHLADLFGASVVRPKPLCRACMATPHGQPCEECEEYTAAAAA